jgi:uncharacterized membrane protein YphA (DoxX/SURF4 family)
MQGDVAVSQAVGDASRARTIAYWVCTAMIAFAFISGGIGQVVRAPPVLEGMTRLGYPVYFIVMLGVWKILGGIAVLLPRFPRVKEWAYAGMVFDLTAASVSMAATDGGVRHVVVPLLLTGVVVASWALRPESRRLRT